MSASRDLSVLKEDQVCEVAARVLEAISGEETDKNALRLNYRVGLADQTLFNLDVPVQSTEGEGIGGHLSEWTIAVVLNLAAAMLYDATKKGIHVVRESESYEKFRTRLVESAGRARTLVDRFIDAVRDEIIVLLEGKSKR